MDTHDVIDVVMLASKNMKPADPFCVQQVTRKRRMTERTASISDPIDSLAREA